jgi:hypothetical protein
MPPSLNPHPASERVTPAACLCLLLWLAMALLAPARAQSQVGEPGFYIETAPAQVNIGDPVQLTLKARDANFSADRIQNILMDPDPALWNLDAQWRRDWKGKADSKTGPWHATLRPFDLGTLTLPAIRISYLDDHNQTTETTLTSQTLSVLSVRKSDAANDLIGLRDPLPLERNWTWLWLTMAGALLVFALIYLALWWWDRHKRHAQALPEAPPLPPGLWALQELDRRSRLPVCRTGPAKVIFSLVSEVLRIYLGRRYGFNGIDMTTAECMTALAVIGFQAPAPEVQRWIREFLEECDLVKFTTIEPPPERWQKIWNDARLIVTQTTPPAELGEEAPFPSPEDPTPGGPGGNLAGSQPLHPMLERPTQ